MKKQSKNNDKNKTPEIEGSMSLEVSFDDILRALIDGYGNKDDEESKKRFLELFFKSLKHIVSKHACSKDYNILVLFDKTTLVKSDSDRIYQAISTIEKNEKPLLLILLSNGGEPGSAYLIGMLCRESCNGKFVVSVPRHAKSAATLLSCAADEIHMGSLSELGPIDPQIQGMPVLGLKNSIEHVAELVSKNPESAQMFAEYLFLSVKPIQIGYYERAAKSAEQYAEKLLNSHKRKNKLDTSAISHKLVYEYKDHSFVIDKTEAKNIFGSEVIIDDSPEYLLGNDLYLELSKIERFADILGFTFYFIGTLDSEPQLVKRKKVD